MVNMRIHVCCVVIWSLYNTLSGDLSAEDEQDYVIMEGDIQIGVAEFQAMHMQPRGWRLSGLGDTEDYLPVHPFTSVKERRSKRAVTALRERVWPNATIPYVIGPNVTDTVERTIYQAMGHWERHTCIKFINRTTQHDYVEFAPGRCGCCSFVGRKGNGRQYVTLSPHCAVYGVVIHELGHVVGFWHEHSRPDRDKYIDIKKENIHASKLDNFERKSSLEIDSLGQPYDYFSVMHYRKTTFSRNGKDTIVPRQGYKRIGQRKSLSPGDILQARLLYSCPKPKCYEEFTGSQANFSTPNYPLNYFKGHDCVWIIHVLPGEKVTLDFEDFAVEKSENCSFDFVEVRQGIDETGPLVGRLCGEGALGSFLSTTSLWIKFHSDSSIALRGFKASYEKTDDENYWGSGESGSGSDGSGDSGSLVPDSLLYRPDCTKQLVVSEGSVVSPMVPTFFPGVVECSWTISGGDNASRVQLSMTPDDEQVTRENCFGDVYQQIKHQYRHHHHHYHSRHGGQLTLHSHQQNVDYDIERYARVRYNCARVQKLLLSTGTVMIQWTSDSHQALKINYVIDYNECLQKTHDCAHFCHNTVAGYSCSCRPGYALHADKRDCKPKLAQFADKCGSVMTGLRGKIRASTEPLKTCLWFIKVGKGYRITLTFSKFDVPFNESCTHSFIEILVGTKQTSKGKFCGKALPPAFTTPSGHMTIKQYADVDQVWMLPYFSARYITNTVKSEQEKCFKRVKAIGNVTSPGFPGRYPPDSFCIWRMSAKPGQRIRIKFDKMDIEYTKLCQFDFIEIRDGRHRTSPLLGRLCGQRIPKKIVSSGRHLWLLFMSDAEGSGRGFRAFMLPESKDAKVKSTVKPKSTHTTRNNATVVRVEENRNSETSKNVSEMIRKDRLRAMIGAHRVDLKTVSPSKTRGRDKTELKGGKNTTSVVRTKDWKKATVGEKPRKQVNMAHLRRTSDWARATIGYQERSKLNISEFTQPSEKKKSTLGGKKTIHRNLSEVTKSATKAKTNRKGKNKSHKNGTVAIRTSDWAKAKIGSSRRDQKYVSHLYTRTADWAKATHGRRKRGQRDGRVRKTKRKKPHR